MRCRGPFGLLSLLVAVAAVSGLVSGCSRERASAKSDGVIEAKQVLSGKPLVLGKSATYRGDLQAPAVEMKLGAKVKPSQFEVPSDPLGLADMDEAGG